MYVGLYDTLQLASKLTLKRIINACKIYSSYQKAKTSARPVISGLPISISIEPTTACNLRCPECPSGLRSFTRPTGKLDISLFRNIIDELAPTLSYLIFYFQGEPYLHPQLLEMIRYASSRKVYTATSTNAHFLTDTMARQTVASGLNRLIISIDGTTQEVYAAYRKGGKLAKVLEGTQNIVKWKKRLRSRTPHIVWQFLVVRPNEHQIPEVKKLARQFGVNKLAFKTAQIYDYKNGNDLIPTDNRYSRYALQDDGSYRLKSKLKDECWKMWHSCVITWDGKVVPCCFDKDAGHVLGNLITQPFETIWQSEAYHQFRESLFTSKDRLEMCQNCTEGIKIWK